MIQKWIRDQLSTVIPELEWTFDYKTAQDHSGVVYHEAFDGNSSDDFGIMYPTYQVELESSDRDGIERIAWKVYETMDKRRQEIIQVNGVEFELIFIEAVPPLPLGITNKKLSYTINLRTTVLKRTNVLNP